MNSDDERYKIDVFCMLSRANSRRRCQSEIVYCWSKTHR